MAATLLRHPFAQRLVATQVLCLAIAALLALSGSHFWLAWLYSVCIGSACLLVIDGCRRFAARQQLRRPGPHSAALRAGWPGWVWMVPIILLGGLLGFTLGALLADLLTGRSTPMPWRDGWRAWVAVLAISVAAAVTATGYFYARSRIAAAEAEVAQVGRLAAETRLKLLESQLEPHMLFNTLANLRALIAVDPERSQAMLDRLIDFLRATLSASRTGLHPLSAEFARLDDYLALMQIRMGERLQVQLDLPPALATLPVPPLLLQPLVENAIKHGLEPQRGGGSIRVSARRGDGGLTLQVLDTGRGLQAPRADRHDGYNSGHNSGHNASGNGGGNGSGFGLAQVRERLSTQYGGRASFSLEAGPEGRGSLATVHLPLDLA